MSHQIVVTIDPQGDTRVAVEGVTGPSCKNVTKQIERALGKTVSDNPTSEFHKASKQGQRISQ